MNIQAQWKRDLLPMLPPKLRGLIRHVDDTFLLEELRIRAGKPVEICGAGVSRLISPIGGKEAASIADCKEIFEHICGHSVYAWEDELKNGFITLPGGYRAGLGGHVVRSPDGHVTSITDISSINFRVSREIQGVADALMPRILRSDGRPYSTLLISPPGLGKTTMLRDIIRCISSGEKGAMPQRVCVIDERMELSGCVRGQAQFDLGPRTDVISSCSKPEGIRMALRTLSPNVIATDELGGNLDADAVQEAAFCGVCTIATAHAQNISALQNRRSLAGLLYSGAIERVVELGRRKEGVGAVVGLYNGALEPVNAQGGELLCLKRF